MALQSFSHSRSSLTTTENPYFPCWKKSGSSNKTPTFNLRINNPFPHFLSIPRTVSLSSTPQSSNGEEGALQGLVEDLRVPGHWLVPSKAIQESEWLRITLHKWLDDEYCPETTNIEISKVAANSYYESLVAKQSDLGEILLKMARDLESISYQESFHGAFSSANAAVTLITLRIEQE